MTEAVGHTLKPRLISILQVRFCIFGQAFAKCFSLSLKIKAERIFVGSHPIPR